MAWPGGFINLIINNLLLYVPQQRHVCLFSVGYMQCVYVVFGPYAVFSGFTKSIM